MNIHLTIEGKAKGKDRPRVGRGGHIYTPKNTKDYEDRVKKLYQTKYSDNFIMDNPFYMVMKVSVKIPKSASKALKSELLEGVFASKKPDLDNIEKIILDSLNGVAYNDDSQCVAVLKYKRWVLTEEEENVTIELGDIDSVLDESVFNAFTNTVKELYHIKRGA